LAAVAGAYKAKHPVAGTVKNKQVFFAVKVQVDIGVLRKIDTPAPGILLANVVLYYLYGIVTLKNILGAKQLGKAQSRC
jgi:hypothetical protein